MRWPTAEAEKSSKYGQYGLPRPRWGLAMTGSAAPARHSEEAARPTWESVLLLPRQPPERKKSCQENRPPDNILLAGKLRYFRIAELCDRLADFFCIMR